MKGYPALIFALLFSITGLTQTNLGSIKDTMSIQAQFGLMGRWQSGNLEQLSLMPNMNVRMLQKSSYAEIAVNYNYLKVGGFNVANDFWVSGLYQLKPSQRFFLAFHTNNGFAKSYKIDYSGLSSGGLGINIFDKSAQRYFQVHLLSGYLQFEFEDEPLHESLAIGSLIRALLPISKQVNLQWEFSTYNSSSDVKFWGGGTIIQLNASITKSLFINIRQQLFYNHNNTQSIEKYNSIMLFGINYHISKNLKL